MASSFRGQVVPEFMVLSILALLLFFFLFAFYTHEQDLVRSTEHSRSAKALGAQLSDEFISFSALPIGSTRVFRHASSEKFVIQVTDGYLHISDATAALLDSRRLLAPVVAFDGNWNNTMQLTRDAEGIHVNLS